MGRYYSVPIYRGNSFYDVTHFYGEHTSTKNDTTKLAIFNGQKPRILKNGGFAMIVR